MKHMLLIAGGLLLSLQAPAYPFDLSVGARLGLNLATVSGDVEDEFLDSSRGGGAALQADLAFNPWLSLQPGLAYTAKGCRWVHERENDDGDLIEVEDISRADYLELPINLAVGVPRPWRVKPYVYAGPALALFLGAHKTVSVDGNRTSAGSRNDSARNLDLGLDWGGGAALGLGPGVLLFDARYTLGLLSVDANNDDDVRNRVLTFSLGYRLPIAGGGK